MSNLSKLRAVTLFSHLSLIGMVIHPPTPFLLGLFLVSYFTLYTVGFSVGLHRYICHRSFDAGPGAKLVFLFLSTLCCVGSPIAWAGVHRHHHRVSDTKADPHSPKRLNLFDIWRGSYWNGLKIPQAYMRDLAQDPWLRFFHRHYFLIIAGFASFLLSFGFEFFIYAFSLPVVVIFHVVSLGIIVVHKWGYRRFETDDDSRNSILLSLFTFGDGWHNNHHHRPQDFAHGKTPLEIDLSAFFIKLYCICRNSSSRVFQEISGVKR